MQAVAAGKGKPLGEDKPPLCPQLHAHAAPPSLYGPWRQRAHDCASSFTCFPTERAIPWAHPYSLLRQARCSFGSTLHPLGCEGKLLPAGQRDKQHRLLLMLLAPCGVTSPVIKGEHAAALPAACCTARPAPPSAHARAARQEQPPVIASATAFLAANATCPDAHRVVPGPGVPAHHVQIRTHVPGAMHLNDPDTGPFGRTMLLQLVAHTGAQLGTMSTGDMRRAEQRDCSIRQERMKH